MANIDYEKEILSMQGLIDELKGLRHWNTGIIEEIEKMKVDEPGVNHYEWYKLMKEAFSLKIENRQLEAEIELKLNVLKEFEKKKEEYDEQIQITAPEAKAMIPTLIKEAKDLLPKMNKQVKNVFETAFIRKYENVYRFKGFQNDEELVAFYSALKKALNEIKGTQKGGN